MGMRMKEWQKVHRKNRAALSKAIVQMNRSLNESIQRKDKEKEYVQARCLFLLWVSWMEVSMDLILHSANKLTEAERKSIVACRREIDRWNLCLDLCFAKHYLTGKKRSLTKINLGPTAFYRFQELKAILKDYIDPYIEIRNRLAHGQWMIAINSEGSGKNQDLTTRLMVLSKKELLLVKMMVKNFVNLVNVLACSKNEFEKKYDETISKMEFSKQENDKIFRNTLDCLHRSHLQKRSLGYY